MISKWKGDGLNAALHSVLIISVFVSFTIASGRCFADEGAPVVSNVEFTVSGLNVTVTYDLSGSAKANYNVALVLRSRSDPSFKYSPKVLTGDVGLGTHAGIQRKIVWNMEQEFPEGLPGNGYYFVVNADEVDADHSTGILTWLGAGAVAIAAVTTYIIVSHNGGLKAPVSYPVPPGRP